MAASRASPATALTRGLRKLCPACGVGHVFGGGVATARACAACGWRFERCAGHWVGGNEVNLLAAFAAGVAAYAVAAAFLGLSHAAAWIATAATGLFSVASYRRCRSLFFAIDYLLDPVPDPAWAASSAASSASAARRRGPGGLGGSDDDADGDGGAGRDRRRDAPDPRTPRGPRGPRGPTASPPVEAPAPHAVAHPAPRAPPAATAAAASASVAPTESAAGSSESFIAPRRAPYPPRATVSP